MGYRIRPDKRDMVHKLIADRTKGTANEIASFLSLGRTSYYEFIKGAELSQDLFEGACKALDLDWLEIAEMPEQMRIHLASQRSTTQGTTSLAITEVELKEEFPINRSYDKAGIAASETVCLDIHSVPDIFEDYIYDRTWLFSGRERVFQKVYEFINTNPSGYLTILGSPGSGKTAILAEFVKEQEKRKKEGIICVAYFNRRNEGNDSIRDCLQSICRSIIDTLSLSTKMPRKFDNSEPLRGILYDAIKNLREKKLVIVIDALDELNLATQDNKKDILYLPGSLPNNVFFLLSRRPYKEERLPTDPIKEIIDINDEEYSEDGEQSIRLYLENILSTDDPWYKGKLAKCIERIYPLLWEEFVDIIVKRSQLNFMYVRHIVRDFATGKYEAIDIRTLPQGLNGYYERHWEIMNVELKELTDSVDLVFLLRIEVLYILTRSVTRLSVNTLQEKVIGSLQKNEHFDSDKTLEVKLKVRKTINDWIEFLKKDFEEDDIKTPTYSIYHLSFSEFINGKLIEIKTIDKNFEEYNDYFVLSHVNTDN